MYNVLKMIGNVQTFLQTQEIDASLGKCEDQTEKREKKTRILNANHTR